MKKVTVKQNEQEPIAAEVLAQSIVDIGTSMKKINSTRLSKKALVILIATDIGLGRGTVEAVLDSLDSLERTYLKPKPLKTI